MSAPRVEYPGIAGAYASAPGVDLSAIEDVLDVEIEVATDWENPLDIVSSTNGVLSGYGHNPAGLFRFNKFTNGTKKWYLGVRDSAGLERTIQPTEPADWLSGEFHRIRLVADTLIVPGSVRLTVYMDGTQQGVATTATFAGFGATGLGLAVAAYVGGSSQYNAPMEWRSAVVRNGEGGPIIAALDPADVLEAVR